MPVPEYVVIVSEAARQMLNKHILFLSGVSIPAAKKLSAEYRKAVQSLATNPERFPFFELADIEPKTYRKCLFSRRYELIFLISEKTVFVDAVRDCRQDPDNLPI